MTVSSIVYPLESRSFLVLYATVTGTAEDTAERIARRGRQEGWAVSVKEVSEFDQASLLEEQFIVFVVPTTGNGTPPPPFVPFWTSLLHPSLPHDLLEDLRYAVFGLGDSSYSRYNWVAKKLSRRLDDLGAISVIERGEGDDQNEWGIESTFPDWMDAFYKAIDPLFPRRKPEIWSVVEKIPKPRVSMQPAVKNGNEELLHPFLWAKDAQWMHLKKNTRVTPSTWYQDVRSIEIGSGKDSIPPYRAGQVLEIRPVNSSKDVEDFLTAVGWSEIADTLYELEPSSTGEGLFSHFPTPYKTTLRHLLTYELDINSVPRFSFMEWLSYFTEGDLQEKLQWFCTGEGQDDLNDYTLRPRRTIREVMYEFRQAKIPPEYVLDLLPKLRPRSFSIASSSITESDHIQLLVAIVKYKTILAAPRKGVCTSYLNSLEVGDRLAVRFESGMLTLPKARISDGKSLTRPLIMVGPGTGVAPFRALMQERAVSGCTQNLLFFGCRSRSQDLYWKEEWEQFEADHKLVFSVAPSRDQDYKVYVQDKIPKYADLIWDYLLQGGVIYICGSSKQMPKAVKKRFIAIFEEKGSLSKEEAEAMWNKLDQQNRIAEETWG